jgi:hypothetical protein
MAFLPQTQRDQKLAVVVILAIGLAAVYWQYAWTPKHVTQVTLTAHLDTLDSLNADEA